MAEHGRRLGFLPDWRIFGRGRHRECPACDTTLGKGQFACHKCGHSVRRASAGTSRPLSNPNDTQIPPQFGGGSLGA